MNKVILFLTILLLSCTANAQLSTLEFSNSASPGNNSMEFKSGEFIFAHLRFTKPLASLLTVEERPVTMLAEYYVKGKLLGDEMFGFEAAKIKGSKISAAVFPIISDPAGDVPLYGKNLFATNTPSVLGKLPAGIYEIEYQLKSYSYKDAGEALATGNFTLTIDSGAKAWFQKNEKDSYEALTKRGVNGTVVSERDIAMGAVGGKGITLVNNCGRSVWLRRSLGSDKREYRLGPNQEMKYDPDSGYLEEWNFKTLKWSTVTKIWSPDSNGKANICK